ncbi:MAG: hypothetical protein M3096_09860 [Actinomycetia bacterium]|nr:hypothetical protein [Actinomycetes bacterium]
MNTWTKSAPAVAAIGLGGCGPPSVVPGPTLSWWLVFVIIGGFVLYAYLHKGR